METRRGRFSWVTVSLLAFILCFLVASLGYGPKERMIPLVIGLPTLLIGLLVLAGEKYPLIRRKFEVSLEDLVSESKPASEGSPSKSPGVLTKEGAVVSAWGAGFFVMVYLVGFYVATPVFLLLFLRMQGRISWGRTLICTLSVCLFIYILFNVLLSEELFTGLLFGAYIPSL